MIAYIPLALVAELAGVTPRAMKKVALKARTDAGYTWRGASLVVREQHGRGGNSGKQYEVFADSLPLDLQERLKAERALQRGPLKAGERAAVEREWRFQLLQEAIKHPRYSRERGAVLAGVVAATHHHPIRGACRVPMVSLQRWLRQFEACGIGGLQDRARKDTGRERVIVSDPWDRAVPFPDAVKQKIRELIRQDLRDLWGNGAVYSVVRRLASESLMAVTRAHGFDPGPEDLARICLLPKSIVEKERDARRVHRFATDRKGWNDRRGRVKRSPDGLQPMQIVMADVHHIDVLVTRPDGSAATPKIITFQDVATHRVIGFLVLCEPGTSVRNVDLIEAFMAMVEHPEWGMPAALYLDNGSEFRFADFLNDALKLRGMRVVGGGEDDRTLIRATPYEGASKGLLEGTFRILQQQVFSSLPGFIGGERMKSKSATLGRPQTPFKEGFEAFSKRVENGIAYLNTNERRGALRGRTPDQLFRSWVKRGWKRIDADPDELMMAFSEEDTRRVTKGKITVSLSGDPRGSITYVHDMFSRVEGQTVKVRLPKFRRWPGIPVYTMQGERIGVAMPEKIYAHNDPAGAIEAKRRKRNDLAAMHELKKSVRQIDINERMGASAKRRMGTAMPESGGVITLDGDLKLDAEEMKDQPPVSAEEQDRIRQAKQAREAAQRAKTPAYPRLFAR